MIVKVFLVGSLIRRPMRSLGRISEVALDWRQRGMLLGLLQYGSMSGLRRRRIRGIHKDTVTEQVLVRGRMS